MSRELITIATDLSEFESADQVEARHNGYWLPCIVLRHAGGETKVLLRYPLQSEELWLPGNAQARWAKVAA